MSKIAVGVSEKYDVTVLTHKVAEMLDALGAENGIRPGMKVVLKPNLITDKNPFFAVTTHPAVVEAVADWLISKGITDITLADSPGGALSAMPGFSFEELYKATGFDRLKNKMKLNTDPGWKTVPAPDGCHNKKFNILNVIADADIVINIPKLKTHNLTAFSFGVKNLFGCIPDIQKPAFHAKYPQESAFAQMLTELAMTVKPYLTVIDAVDIIEGNGPIYGTKRNMGMLFASDDVFSLDAFLAKKLIANSDSTQLICAAKNKKLLSTPEFVYGSAECLDGVQPLILPDSKLAATGYSKIGSLIKNGISKLYRDLTVAEPFIDPVKCTKCGRCVLSCPQKAISIEKNAVIDHAVCINCLCCNEVCPSGAADCRTKLKIKN